LIEPHSTDFWTGIYNFCGTFLISSSKSSFIVVMYIPRTTSASWGVSRLRFRPFQNITITHWRPSLITSLQCCLKEFLFFFRCWNVIH
jgi:hypothetical protein